MTTSARQLGRRRTTKGIRPRRTRRAPLGFTLIETMFAILIIGLGVVVILRSMVQFLSINTWSTHSASATYLAGEIRELTRSLPRHDTFSGGLYYTDPSDPDSFGGWGLESDELIASDIDDIDDLDGLVFGDGATFPEGFTMSRRFPGPINSFGEVLEEVLYDGSTETIEVDGEIVPISMRGWTQIVQVNKVDPTNYSTIIPNSTHDLDNGRNPDDYPLMVTVTILYNGVWDETAPPIESVSWIVPARTRR